MMWLYSARHRIDFSATVVLEQLQISFQVARYLKKIIYATNKYKITYRKLTDPMNQQAEISNWKVH